MGFAKWKGSVAEASTVAARAFGAVGGSVPVYSKSAAGVEDYSLDATVVDAPALFETGCAVVDCCTDAGHATHPFARFRSYCSAVLASVHVVSWAAASAAWATNSLGLDFLPG
jgi:hypothetical protein